MPAGQIVCAISGFYYVRTPESGKDIQCRARGLFKKKKLSPLVGDRVMYEETNDGEGIITEVYPRQTQLIRPPIANVEQAIVVCSLREPDFQSTLLDRFLVHCEREGLKVVICLTKSDLLTEEEGLQQILKTYEQAGYPLVVSSIRDEDGAQDLIPYLQGVLSVFAGQSGVGKSSLLNMLVPQWKLETGEVSHKLGRGKHTTRQVNILDLPMGGQVADTPGFSQLDFTGMEAEQLGAYFPEIEALSVSCRFRGCLHHQEPGCAVRAAEEASELSGERYAHYVQFLEEIQEQWRYKKW
ncbi:ribosome small subunit-dependent GTPase A [Mechercharimyces sp. CAU 1602]|uniref:ribosome small subunit-dependent GTPase A n=1 Tax=Mechercharimyces sp. CAU 1602 TaxID=2973933 RepID=UPI002161233B|nr:ribosome small subunit-dependent GTPase A [Mechercharimyces sp. CAU 1602]MCS1351387.1 ribosome small subunit-dependent GTPase A [Mechercharimyces sp. CAU 1602]